MCEGDATSQFDIDVMYAQSARWIRRRVARIISKNIELAANQGGKKRDVVVSVMRACRCFQYGAALV